MNIDKQVCEINLKNIKEKFEAHEKDINELKEVYKAINNLTISINNLTTETRYMREEQGELKQTVKSVQARIKHMEDAPGKKWERLTWYVITFVVGVALAALVSQMGLS